MTPRYEIRCGDVRDRLREMPSESVHCCVTSPPYFGLRDYNVEGQIGCEKRLDCLGWATGEPCGECHICVIVSVFREVRRVLRRDGTLWLNYGDCYATSQNGRSAADVKALGKDDRTFRDKPQDTVKASGLKPKDLCMVPARVALALQADGWWVRSEICWAKKSPMPESVTDRPTSAHEKIFLLTRSEKYFYDADAVREKDSGKAGGRFGTYPDSVLRRDSERKRPDSTGTRNLRNVWHLSPEPLKSVPVYGRRRTTSEDCPIHGCQAHPESVPRCDAQSDAFSSDGTSRIDDRLVQSQEDAVSSNSEYRPAFPSDETSATLHNSKSRRTGDELGIDETSGDIPEFRTEYTESVLRSAAISDRTHGSSTGLGSSPDGLVTCLSAQMPFRNTDTSEAQEELSVPFSSGNGDALNSHENNTAAGFAEHGHSAQIETNSTGIEISAFEEPPLECTCKYTRVLLKSQDHYAAYPTIIPKRAILAGTSEKGCCPCCGKGWVRVVEEREKVGGWNDGKGCEFTASIKSEFKKTRITPATLGWQPACSCGMTEDDLVPATVLDPFLGSGTTVAVALSLGRRGIGIELNPDYIALAEKRIAPYAAQEVMTF